MIKVIFILYADLAFQILKTQATKILNPFIPGLEQMFYMLV